MGGSSGAAYTTSVLAYNTAYQPTRTTITIPGSEIGSAAPLTYTYAAVYDPGTGLLLKDARPAVADIAAEQVNYNYDTAGTLQSYGSPGFTYDLSNDYDAYGRPIRATLNPWGTQIVVTNTFDEPTGRQLAQYVDKQTASTGAVQQTTYAYDPARRITAIRAVPDNTPPPPTCSASPTTTSAAHHCLVRHRQSLSGGTTRGRWPGLVHECHTHQRRAVSPEDHHRRPSPVLADVRLRPHGQPEATRSARPGR
ncbi:hypothetical protein ACFQ1I_41455 [Kitasatospora arboriphila]